MLRLLMLGGCFVSARTLRSITLCSKTNFRREVKKGRVYSPFSCGFHSSRGF